MYIGSSDLGALARALARALAVAARAPGTNTLHWGRQHPGRPVGGRGPQYKHVASLATPISDAHRPQ